MFDILSQIDATERIVEERTADGTELIAVVMRRRYDAPPADVWSALTDPDRLKRWFLPVSADSELRVGGQFQLEGNAGGEIRRCDPPKSLLVTFGGETSLVQVTLTPDGDDGTLFELDHTVPKEMAGDGTGALWVGPGWDGAVASLGLFVRGIEAEDPAAFASSLEAQEMGRRSNLLWADAIRASGTATEEAVAEALKMANGHYAPDLTGDDEGSDEPGTAG